MSGYNGFSKSNNACEAESCGRFPASVIARELGVPTKFVSEKCGFANGGEWHHSSKFFNAIRYYDLDSVRDWLTTEEGATALTEWKVASKNVEVKRFDNCDVAWLEWGGTRRHPHATERTASGCIVEDHGGKFVTVRFQDGREMKKGRDTRGFEVTQGGKRIWL